MKNEKAVLFLPTMDFFSGREYQDETESGKKPSQEHSVPTGPEPKNVPASSMTMDFFAMENPQEEKETTGYAQSTSFAQKGGKAEEASAFELPVRDGSFDALEQGSEWFPQEMPTGGYQPLSFGFEEEPERQAPMDAAFFDLPQKTAAQNQTTVPFDIMDENKKENTQPIAAQELDFGVLEQEPDASMKGFAFTQDDTQARKKEFDFDALEKNMEWNTQAEFDFAALSESETKAPAQAVPADADVRFDLPDEPQGNPFDFGTSDPFGTTGGDASDATIAFDFGNEKKTAVPNETEDISATKPMEKASKDRSNVLNGYQPLSFGFEEEPHSEPRLQQEAVRQEAPRITPVPPAQEMPKRPAPQPMQADPVAQPAADPLPVKPIRAAKDEPTLAFTPADIKRQETQATVAFVPVGTPKPDPVKPPESAAPVQDAAKAAPVRSEKEKDIGAAVFSALMGEEQKAGDAGTVSQLPNQVPVRRGPKKKTAPQPIDWHALDYALDKAAEKTSVPKSAAPAEKPGVGTENATPIAFDFKEFSSGEADIPEFGGSDLFGQDAETSAFDDFFDSKRPEEQNTGVRDVPRRSATQRQEHAPRANRPQKEVPHRKAKRPNNGIFAWLALIAVALMVVLFFVFKGGNDEQGKPGSSGSSSSSLSEQTSSVPSEPGSETESGTSSDVPAEAIPRGEWYMVLANRSSVLSADFAVETAKVAGVEVDARIAEPLKNMIDAAAAEGIKLKPMIGYRSMKWQTEKWNARVEKLMKEKNLSREEAEKKAIDFTSAPGTSDHNTGLGLDIVSEDHPSRDAAFAESKGAKWLAEHAVQYGFILRYPSDKTAQTGMDYEPWHYRYVGTEQALKMKESGLCLEEYLK